jgi:hypothetical protein
MNGVWEIKCVYLLSCVFEKEVERTGGCISGKFEKIVEQEAGQCMDGWKSDLICEVDGVPAIEFRLTSIIPSIRKLRIAHKIPTL